MSGRSQVERGGVTSGGNSNAKRDQTLLGLVPWRPQKGSKSGRCLEDVLAILGEWVRPGTVPSLTQRAILYRLLPLGWGKSDEDHPLGYVLERARRAGIIPFEWIADGRSQSYRPVTWTSPEHFRSAVREWASDYRLDPLRQQPSIEVWIETAGMLEMFIAVSDELGVPLFTSSGMNTLSAKHEAAQRLIEHDRTVVVFVGDLDPWGEARYGNVQQDVVALARDLANAEPEVVFVTAALTKEQATEYAIPTEPAKASIGRHGLLSLPGEWEQGDPTAQAEALPPDVLLETVRQAVLAHLDADVLEETKQLEQEHRVRLRAWIGEPDA